MSAKSRSCTLFGVASAVYLAACAVPTEPNAPVVTLQSLTAEQARVDERTPSVRLTADWTARPSQHAWKQVAGPPVGLVDHGPGEAIVQLSDLEVAVETVLVFEVSGAADATSTTQAAEVSVAVEPIDRVSAFGENVQIGGGSTVVRTFVHSGREWMAYNAGNRLSLTPVAVTAEPVASLHLPGFVHDIVTVERDGRRFLLAAMGTEGIAVVDASAPALPVFLDSVQVNYEQAGITWAEGGGDIIPDNVILSVHGPITALATDGETLWIGDAGYGLHRTSLANLLGPDGIVREADGTLQIDTERYVLQYAGEVPWGAPNGIALHDGRLFVAQGALGLWIYDAETLEPIGSYNLYTDATFTEDWFVDLDVRDAVQHDPVTGEPYLDALTGMPDYRQANFEVAQVWHAGVEAPTPWAEFDRYGQYYYRAHQVDVAGQGERDIAYVAYGLGGLVAVDVTGYRDAGPGDAWLQGRFLGYAPAAPAHGPDKLLTHETDSLYPHYGAGMLKEAGVTSVRVAGDVVWFGEHFAGLVALGGAGDPEHQWHGPAAHYDNDLDGILGNHFPDYEFVTSWDMSPWDPMDHESLPTWIYEPPALLATGEVIGHGGPLAILAGMDPYVPGGADIAQAAGGGGVVTLDVTDLAAPDNADRFASLAWYPTTDEVGAAADGSPTQPISIGHAQGVVATGQYLYLGDGPHGISAWRIADAEGNPIDEVRLVGNTVQDEYPVVVGDETVYPATHASRVIFDPRDTSVLGMCQSVGVRRVPVTGVESGLGQPGSPLLLGPQPTDIFEHGGEEEATEPTDTGVHDEGGGGSDPGVLHGQDHAYHAALDGDLAFVADGSNGLTVYDLTKDPTNPGSGFIVGNLGGEKGGKPALGRATAVALWTEPQHHHRYAFLAAGPRGVGVVDATDPTAMTLVKVFEPIKMEDDTIGKADGRAVDVHVVGNVAWFSYSSFGLVAFDIADLIAPLPEGVDPTEIWSRGGEDLRPIALSQYKLTDSAGYEDVDFEFLYMAVHEQTTGQVLLYVASGAAGLTILDGTDAAAPVLLDVLPTAGEATDVAVANGRMYVADYSGGLAAFK